MNEFDTHGTQIGWHIYTTSASSMAYPLTRNVVRKWLPLVLNHPYGAILVVCLATVLFAWHIPGLRFETAIYDLAIENLPETTYYRNFKKQFGTEEIIFVVATADNIFDTETFARIGDVAERLSQIKGVRRVLGLPGIQKDMDLTTKWSLSDFENIIGPIDLFQKNFISKDKKKTALSLLLEDVEDKTPIIHSIQNVIQEEKAGPSLYQIGMPLVSKALAAYTEKDFKILPPITFLVISLILLALFRNGRGVLVPAGSVGIALIWTFGVMAWTGTPLSFLTMVVPVFLIAVGTAYCMHILSEYRSAAGTAGSPAEAVLICFEHVGLPTILAVITTSIGVGALLLNRIQSIREFAIFSCFGMASMLLVMLVFLPAVLVVLPLPKKGEGEKRAGPGIWDRFLERIIHVNLRHQKSSLSILAAVTVIAICGIFLIRVETNPVDFFKKDTPISRHFSDIQQGLAGSFPINVILDSKIEGYFEEPSHLRQIEEIQHVLDGLPGVDKTMSFADFLKLIHYATNKYDSTYYSIPAEPFEVRMAMNSYKSMLGQDSFERFMTADTSKANVLLRTHLSSSEGFLTLKQEIENYLAENYSEKLDYHVTGFGIVISQSSRLLTRGQLKSLSLTLTLIFVIMIILFVSTKVGLFAIIPNCFPVVINFGLMGWLGIDLSVTTSLIASIAIGLAVDDTIHYMVRYNREFKKDLDKDRALRDTIRQVGRPIIFTSLTIGLGFCVLIFSQFTPTAVFGLLMMVTMASALVGDLIILPSLMRHAELVTAWDLLKLMPSLGGVSAGMAHELRQPLNAIKMGSEFLKMMIQQGGRVPEEQLREVVKEIDEQADRASEIINRLSEFGRKADFAKEEVDINEAVEKVLAILTPQLSLENIHVHRELTDHLPPVLAHGNRIAQVAYNVIINARDAIHEKGAGGRADERIITIRSFRAGDQVVLSVSDTGAGMPPYTRDRILEPFFTTKVEGSGRGLGLSITNQIVKDHGGRIEVESKEGRGTTFTIHFPALRA